MLYGLNVANTSWLTSGTASAQNSQLPTAISGLDANDDSGNFDNVDYAGSRTGLTTAVYRAAISDVSSPNFTQSDTRFNLSTGGFTSTTSVNFTWDNIGSTAGTGGPGTWDATTTNKWTNSANDTFFRWVNSSMGNQHTAVFGGAAGSVTVATGGVTASGLQFDATGYVLEGNSISLSNNTTPVVSVSTAGHTATISAPIAATEGLTKSGDGKLTLTGDNTLSGTVSVSGGILSAAGTTTNQALGDATAVNVTSGTLLLGASSQINDLADLTLG